MGLLVYFGYPQAHEDDAQCAVRTGLDIVGMMGTLNARLERDKGLRLTVRVGIHTGLVVVGGIGGSDRQEQLALGDTPNIAARLQGLAAPDTVLISEATSRLVQGFYLPSSGSAGSQRARPTSLGVSRLAREWKTDTARRRNPERLDTAGGARGKRWGLLLERWSSGQDTWGKSSS